MLNNKIYIGEDAAFIGEVTFEPGDTSSSLNEFDVDIGLSTTPFGKKFAFSSRESARLPVEINGDNFIIRLNSAQTSRFTAGMLTVTISFKHKSTGVKSVCEGHLLPVAEPYNKFYYES